MTYSPNNQKPKPENTNRYKSFAFIISIIFALSTYCVALYKGFHWPEGQNDDLLSYTIASLDTIFKANIGVLIGISILRKQAPIARILDDNWFTHWDVERASQWVSVFYLAIIGVVISYVFISVPDLGIPNSQIAEKNIPTDSLVITLESAIVDQDTITDTTTFINLDQASKIAIKPDAAKNKTDAPKEVIAEYIPPLVKSYIGVLILIFGVAIGVQGQGGDNGNGDGDGDGDNDDDPSDDGNPDD